MKIAKQDPPGRFRYDWDEIIATAKANPGEWIKPEREYPHSVYSVLANGKNSLLPTDQFKFRTSGTRYDIEGKRWCYIYFQYVGPTDERESNT
jgi:hypothetical protein